MAVVCKNIKITKIKIYDDVLIRESSIVSLDYVDAVKL